MDKPKSGHNGLGYRPNASITVDTHPPYLLWADISPKANAQWVLTDVINMVEFLVPHVSADGNKYKAPVIRSLTDYLNDRIIVGGLKKMEGVRQKLADVRYLLPLFRRSHPLEPSQPERI
ncbi:hypothetical protein C8J57DRAFT_1075647 [Mycena rebaudengoi]|nr:hypothetical protein C8J57DRAFT_1075647 [Mycena rebaudengoi]